MDYLICKTRGFSHHKSDIVSSFCVTSWDQTGMPLSPYLFAIAMEPLASSIRQNTEVNPIIVEGRPQHISLYADDVLLYITEPETSIPPLLNLLESYSAFSGFTINWKKSELMPLTINIEQHFLDSVKFKIAHSSIKYLGITITRKPEVLLRTNWQKKVVELKDNIDFWKTLPLSMAGRINAIKMVTLPCFLYLFQSIPSFIPLKLFEKLDSMVISFLWNCKTVRIAKKHTCTVDVGWNSNQTCEILGDWALYICVTTTSFFMAKGSNFNAPPQPHHSKKVEQISSFRA